VSLGAKATPRSWLRPTAPNSQTVRLLARPPRTPAANVRDKSFVDKVLAMIFSCSLFLVEEN
jgi:hypothetical protein